MFDKVAVLSGGHASEREISLQSGQAVFKALQALGKSPVLIDTRDPWLHSIEEHSFDCAFIAVHGRGGEDGTLQGVLDYLKLPYTGSGVLASALGMDKLRCKFLWQGMQLPTPPFVALKAGDNVVDKSAHLSFPLMIKPSQEGSSFGIAKVDDVSALQHSFDDACQYDDSVVAEAFVRGKEFTVAVLNGDPLPVIQLQTDRPFYDFHAKYQSNSTRYLLDTGLSKKDTLFLQNLAIDTFNSIGASAWGRVDVMQDESGHFWLLEINTVPGLTEHSLVPMAAKAAGIDFPSLIDAILKSSSHDGR